MMRFGRSTWMILGSVLLVIFIAGYAGADGLASGEQGVPLNGPRSDEAREAVREAVAALDGVAECHGNRGYAFTVEEGGRVSIWDLKEATEALEDWYDFNVRSLSFGEEVTFEITFTEEKVPDEASEETVLDVISGQRRVATVERISPRTFRVTTGTGGFLRLFGSVIMPVCRALGNCANPLLAEDYIEDIVWVSPGEDSTEAPEEAPAESDGSDGSDGSGKPADAVAPGCNDMGSCCSAGGGACGGLCGVNSGGCR